MRHNISVRQSDRPIWDAAVEAARQRRMPVSGLIMAALDAWLRDHGTPPRTPPQTPWGGDWTAAPAPRTGEET